MLRDWPLDGKGHGPWMMKDWPLDVEGLRKQTRWQHQTNKRWKSGVRDYPDLLSMEASSHEHQDPTRINELTMESRHLRCVTNGERCCDSAWMLRDWPLDAEEWNLDVERLVPGC